MKNCNVTPEEARMFLGVTINCLYCWRKKGKGPEYSVINGRLYYDRDSLEKVRRERFEKKEGPEGYADTKKAARIVGCTVSNMLAMRLRNKGPSHITIDGRIYYNEEGLREFAAARNKLKSGPEGYISISEAIKIIGCSDSALQKRRTAGWGPFFIRDNKTGRIYYREEDIHKFSAEWKLRNRRMTIPPANR